MFFNLFNKKSKIRYFLVFFSGDSKQGKIAGTVTFEQEHFVNQKNLMEHLDEKLEYLSPKNIIVTNILELNKIDFHVWKAENDLIEIEL